MIQHIAPLILKAMISFIPLTYPSAWPKTEQPQTTLARYESISEDIAEGALNSTKSSDTNVFDNDDKGIKIGLLLAIIAAGESHYAADVDTCKRGGDNNTSWTIFQLTSAYAPKNIVCGNRKEAVRYAIKFIKQSFTACRYLPFNDRLSAYDTGHCVRGERISNQRLGTYVFHGMAGMAVSGLQKTLTDFSTDIAAL